jgi:monoamine oxidase
VLVGFIGEPLSDDPALLEPDAVELRRRTITEELAATFGPPASAPLDYVEKDWRAEPYLDGCVPAVPPGVLSDAARPDARWGRVSWAGAETSDRWEGHMDGAIRSGERAGVEALGDRTALPAT